MRGGRSRTGNKESFSETGTAACCFLKSCFTTGKGAGGAAGKGMTAAAELHLRVIRQFRDNVLKKNAPGKLAILFYYYVLSPPVVLLMRHSRHLSQFVGRKFVPLLAKFCENVVGAI